MKTKVALFDSATFGWLWYLVLLLLTLLLTAAMPTPAAAECKGEAIRKCIEKCRAANLERRRKKIERSCRECQSGMSRRPQRPRPGGERDLRILYGTSDSIQDACAQCASSDGPAKEDDCAEKCLNEAK